MGNAAFEPKKFAVIGAGPVGCIVAAFLAKGGYEVTLCDIDMALLAPALDPGISIEGTDTLQAKVARVTTRIDDLRNDRPDVIVVAVKAIALPAVSSALRALFDAQGENGGEGPYVISWQNGIDTELLLAQQLGSRVVMRGVVNLGCVPLAPGRIRIGFHIRPHHIQELDPSSRDAAIAICKVFTEVGLDTYHSDQIRDLVWKKAILNGCMNPICAVTGKTMAELIEDPILFHLVGALIKEGVAVARANEYTLGSGFYPYCIDYIKSAGHHKPSMLQDIEAGRRTEVDFINGKIAEYGAQAEVPTPYNTMIRGLVKALESKGKVNGLEKIAIDIRTRVESLAARMFDEPQYPSQGAVLFVDLERRKAFSKFLAKDVFRTFLSNRGGNMYLLYNLLLEGREALDPQVPLIFGSGVHTEATHPVARGHVASVSPDHHGILDSNCHEAFPAFLKLQGYDHLVLYGQASAWTLLELSADGVKFHDAAPYLGMDNRDFTQIIEKDFSCTEHKDMAMARITRAGENQVLCSAIMGGPKAMYARGGTGAKMGGLKLKAVLILGQQGVPALAAGPQHLPAVPAAPWADQLDAEHLAGYRLGLEGCQQCPIRCNNGDPRDIRRPLDQHHDLAYVAPEGLGPMLGITDQAEISLINRMAHHLGLDAASTGAAIVWAMELYAKGIITRTDTRGLELTRGNAEVVKKLLTLTAKREGFGDVIADSTQAVERGKYTQAALPYRINLNKLFQSDPHDESILEGFAMGFAEALRGGDQTVPVGDAVGQCRFAARQAQAAPDSGLGDFAQQMKALTQEDFSVKQLEEVGLNISGMERLINSRLGLVGRETSLLDTWLDEEIPEGPFAGEKLDKAKFVALKEHRDAFLGMNGSGVPSIERHRGLAAVTTGFAIKVTLPDNLPGTSEGAIILDQPLGNVEELRAALKRRFPQAAKQLSDKSLIIAVGGTLVMTNEKAFALHNGDEIAVLRVQAGA
jgi:aldehyde:ferredoxin oxidoreductase